MNDRRKKKTELIEELKALRRENAELKLRRPPSLNHPRPDLDSLESYEILLADIQRLAKVGHWYWNKITNEVWWSEELRRLSGLSATDPVDFNLFVSLLHPDDKDRVLSEIDQALNGQPFASEHRTCLPDGRVRFHSVRAELIYDAQGNPIGMKGIGLDITERKEIEQKLYQANLDLENQIKKQRSDLDTSYHYLLEGLSQHQALQKKLSLTKKNYKNVIDTASEGIWQTDPQGNTVMVNLAMAKMLGYSVAEMEGKPFQDFINPDSLADLKLDSTCQEKEGCIHRQNCRFYHRDGSTLWALVSVTSIFDSQHHYLGRLQMVTDITEHQETEQALSNSEQFIQTLLDTMPLPLFWKDRESRFLGCNQRLSMAMGLSSPAEIVGKSDFDLGVGISEFDLVSSKSEAIAYRRDDEEVMTSGEPKLAIQETITLPNGVKRHIETHKAPLRDGSGKIIGVVGVFQDITERKENESALKEFNRRWRSLLHQIQMLVVEVDQQGKIRYVNPFFEKVAQVKGDDIIGQSWFETFISPDRQARIYQSFTQALQTQFPDYIEEVLVTPSRQEHMISWHNTVLNNTNGEAIGVISIGRDITERYHLERLKSEFMSIVSHELRTPLTYLQSSLSLLSDVNLDLSPQDSRMVTGIAMQGIDRLVRLVNDILDLERLEAGQIVIKKQKCDPQTIVQTVIAALADMASQAHIHLQTSIVVDYIWADPDRLGQVLINLLSNAIKFSEPNCTVEIAVCFAIDEHPLGPKRNVVLFKIADQGRGITPQCMDTIFERFHQADSSDIRAKEGIGLGLALCRNVVERHGGRIWAESNLGQGTNFYFTLPLNPSYDHQTSTDY